MPRFTGKQYPGAMKDYRAIKREEAVARQARANDRQSTDLVDALYAFGGIIAAPCVIMTEAFVKFGEALGELMFGAREQTQDDFALIPGTTVVRNDSGPPEEVLTPRQWAERARSLKLEGDQ